MSAATQDSAKSSFLPRLLFVLWCAWLLALIVMSRNEWGRSRVEEKKRSAPPENRQE